MASVKGETASGFAYSVDPDCLDDFYFLETFAKAQKGDLSALSEMLTMMLGEKQKTALLKHCEDSKGRAKLSRVGDEIADIYKFLKDTSKKVKNS